MSLENWLVNGKHCRRRVLCVWSESTMFAEAILSELLLLPPVLKTETITDTMILNIEAIIGPTIF